MKASKHLGQSLSLGVLLLLTTVGIITIMTMVSGALG